MKPECSNCYKFQPVCSAYGLCNGELSKVRNPNSSCRNFISIEVYNAIKYFIEKKANI